MKIKVILTTVIDVDLDFDFGDIVNLQHEQAALHGFGSFLNDDTKMKVEKVDD